MLTLTDIPSEVFLVALDLLGAERPADPADAKMALESAEARMSPRGLALTDGTPISAFGAAIAMYVGLSGPFAEDGGEFSGVGGYQVSP